MHTSALPIFSSYGTLASSLRSLEAPSPLLCLSDSSSSGLLTSQANISPRSIAGRNIRSYNTRSRSDILYMVRQIFNFSLSFPFCSFLFYLILYCFSLFSSFISVGCEVNLGRQASRPNTRACSCGLVSHVHCSCLPFIIFE